MIYGFILLIALPTLIRWRRRSKWTRAERRAYDAKLIEESKIW